VQCTQPISQMGVSCRPLGVDVEDEYRKKAEDCLRLAEQSSDTVLRGMWLELAEVWWKLVLRVSALKAKRP
jgi:hypothetical protein